jgi:hypothetical protein
MELLHSDGALGKPNSPDRHIESYLKWLENLRRNAGGGQSVITSIQAAWRYYGTYRQTGNTDSRRLAWAAIHAAAASLRRVRQLHKPR